MATDSLGVRLIDYIASPTFDQAEEPKNNMNKIRNTSDTFIAKIASKLDSTPPTSSSSSAQLSSTTTKDKRKWQKEAENVETLRILVGYLRQGHQPVAPVALDPEELELAEMYKLHEDSLAVNRNSNPHIGAVSWVLRHSVSDPGGVGGPYQLQQQHHEPQSPHHDESHSPRLTVDSDANSSYSEKPTMAKMFYIDDLERKDSDSSDTNSTSNKTSTWTNPQNLATWIDEELRNLVNDLETKSQLVKSSSKSGTGASVAGKFKWFSGGRRNSSGAHST